MRAQIPEERGQSPSGNATQSAPSPKYDGLIQQAVQQYQAGRLNQARSTVVRARQIDPLQTVSYQMEAQIALDLGDREGYIAALRDVLHAHPQSAPMQNRVGKLLLQAQERKQGIEALRRAVRLNPRHAGYSRDLSAVLLVAGESEEAASVLVHATRYNPGDLSLPLALARLYEAEEQWENAVAHYDFILRKNPHHIPWRRQRARCLYRAGEFRRACDDFAFCLQRDREQVSMGDRIQYGDACLRIGDYGRAQIVLDRVSAESRVRLKELELLRGLCALRRGEVARAKGILDTALNRWPGDEELLEVMTLCESVHSR